MAFLDDYDVLGGPDVAKQKFRIAMGWVRAKPNELFADLRARRPI